MRKLLNDITKKVSAYGDKPFASYMEMRNHPGWETHRNVIAEIRLGIVSEMLSERFTKLSPAEKDSQQKAFYMTDQVLKYLLNPLEVEAKRERFKMKYSKAMGTNPITGKDLK